MSEEQAEKDPDRDTDSGEDSGASRDVDTGEPGEVGDDQLPADVRPTEDNPLARHPDQTGDDDDEIGADREGHPETAPLTEDEGDYSDSDSSDSDKD